MGWIAINNQNEILREDIHGRPVQAGEEGNLKFILQEDFGHKVAIDLRNGVIIIDYDDWQIQEEDIEIYNPRTVLYICDDTNIGAELAHGIYSEPDKEGWYSIEWKPMTWRPIWFTRYTNGVPTKVIGAQATTPEQFGSKNIKKMVSLFATGVLGID